MGLSANDNAIVGMQHPAKLYRVRSLINFYNDYSHQIETNSHKVLILDKIK